MYVFVKKKKIYHFSFAFPKVKSSPTKSTPSKRKSKLERERAESEEIIKAMGGAVEEGGRRTRSSARGATATPATPPPAKKPRVATPRRGRPKKDDAIIESEKTDQVSVI